MTCGEGGMVTFNNEDAFVRARAIHDHGHAYSDPNRANDPAICSGFNYRMTEIQAAIGMVQLTKLGKIVDAQRENKARLKKRLAKLNFSFRTIIDESGDIGDSLVVLLGDRINPKTLSKLIQDHSIPTKNIPDAIRWHYAGFWQHLLGPEAPTNYKKSDEYLFKSIAVPVNVLTSQSAEDQIVDFFIALKAL